MRFDFRVAARTIVAAALLAFGVPLEAAATVGASSNVTVTKVTAGSLPLDPALTDPAWAALQWYSDFADLSTKARAAAGTSAAIAYDDKFIYVAFRSVQPGPITATQPTSDIGFGIDDFVGVGFDVSGNGERAYYFETTPRGTRYQQAAETSRYSPAWRALTVRTPEGWNAILVIPIGALSLSAGGAQHWRVNFIRSIAATNAHFTLAYDPLMPDWQGGPGFRETRWWPGVAGVSLASGAQKPRVRLEPYALGGVGSGRNIYVDAAGNESPRNERHAGIDLAVPITSTVTGVASLNPDFSNVEIDQQTIAPQQFQRSLVETRPFFAQGAQYINAARQIYEFNLPPDELFYSPNIGPFDRGFKVEGTSGMRSFGVLETRGSDPTFDDIAFGFTHHRPNNTLAFWTDGALANLTGGHDGAAEIGASGRSLASGLVYSLQYGREWGSFVANPGDAQSLRGFLDIQRAGTWGGVESALAFVDIGPQYNPQIGFTNIADVRGPEFFLDTTRNFAAGSALKNAELYFYTDRWLDAHNAVHLSDLVTFLTFRTNKAMRFVLGDTVSSQLSYDGNTFSGYYTGYADPVTLPFKYLSAEAVLGDGSPNSFDAYYQFGPFNGPYVNNFNLVATRQLPRNLSLSLQYSGNLERPGTGPEVSQWLTRYALGIPLGANSNASISYRVISGVGGFATPGKNFAAAFHVKFRNLSELYVNWGAPAAASTVDRFIVKYVFRVNGGLTS